MTALSQIKPRLHALIVQSLDERVSMLRQEMQDNQEAANEETKSSAGDKYETGRSMIHLESEKTATQLSEALKLRKALDQLNPKTVHDVIKTGSLVKTSQGNYYLGISAGKMAVDGQEYFAISAASPIGQQLMGRKEGEEVEFNQRNIKVLEIA
jgi:transcription elongation GreA/GreB family factor